MASLSSLNHERKKKENSQETESNLSSISSHPDYIMQYSVGTLIQEVAAKK